MRRRTAVLAAIPLLFAAACGTAQKTDGVATPSDIKITGPLNAKPVVTFPAGKPALTSTSMKIAEGAGVAAKDGDVLIANVTVYLWDGKENKSSGSAYDTGKSEFVTVSPELPKALHDALVGAKPGGRVVAVIGKDSLTDEQVTQAKQQGTDFTASSQVLVVDVVSVPPRAAQGTPSDPGIAGVKLENPGGDKAPTLTTKTSAKPPKDLVVKTVIEGPGPEVKADQTVLAHYTGKIWGTGKQFDSSWERGAPTPFALSDVVKGWSQGLTGVKLGSRVLITIPPDLGYGKEGNPQGGIKGTDTLVFVVDVLGAT
jgi:peptidylprolyl isomerase